MASMVMIRVQGNAITLADGTELQLDATYRLGKGTFEVYLTEKGPMAAVYNRVGDEQYWLLLDRDGEYQLLPDRGLRVPTDQEEFEGAVRGLIQDYLLQRGAPECLVELKMISGEPVRVRYGGDERSYTGVQTDGDRRLVRHVPIGGRRRDEDDDFVEHEVEITGGSFIIVREWYRSDLVQLTIWLRPNCTRSQLAGALRSNE